MGGLIKGILAQIQSWFGVYNIRYYGADSTGTKDSTTAIQNSINACHNAGGGKVIIPPGTFLFSSSLTLYSGVCLEGSLYNASILKYTGTGAAIGWAAGTNWTWGYIRHINFEGNANADGALYVNDTHEGFIEHCNFYGFKTYGISLQTAYTNRISNNRFTGMVNGIIMGANANAVMLFNNQHGSHSGAAVLINGYSYGAHLWGNQYESCNSGIEITPSGGVNGLTIRGTYAEGNTNGLLYVPTMSGGNIYGLDVAGNYCDCSSTANYAINIDSGSGGGAVSGKIQSLSAWNVGTAAIRIVGANNNVNMVCEDNEAFATSNIASETVYSSDMNPNVFVVGKQYLTRQVIQGAQAVAQSSTSLAVATGGTIPVDGLGSTRVNPTAAVTGVILAAGRVGGQEVWVVNESAYSVTLATGNFTAQGYVINAQSASKFVWDSGTSLWYKAS